MQDKDGAQAPSDIGELLKVKDQEEYTVRACDATKKRMLKKTQMGDGVRYPPLLHRAARANVHAHAHAHTTRHSTLLFLKS